VILHEPLAYILDIQIDLALLKALSAKHEHYLLVFVNNCVSMLSQEEVLVEEASYECRLTGIFVAKHQDRIFVFYYGVA
jgi:hypothetical protein